MNATVLPPTTTRVERNTSAAVNRKIERETAARIAAVVQGGPGAIERRLARLDGEWDIERLLEANASTVILIAMTLGFLENRKWFRLPVVIAGFLLLHALQGWCPPVPILRRLGVRTAREINRERTALRLLRGDFFQTGTDDPQEAFRVAGEG